MGIFKKFIAVLFFGAAFLSCEDRIYPDLATNVPIIVVDAWITNQPVPQTIKITLTQPYFDSSRPTGVAGATVTITDERGKQYDFLPSANAGEYMWHPTSDTPLFGESWLSYDLDIQVDGKHIVSSTLMGRVPPIDSVRFHFVKATQILPDSYFAEMWARDPLGPGDTYWVRTWKNGQPLNKPREISVAYDAGFSAGGIVDGLVFIQPIRDSVNPFDENVNDTFLAPYGPGDSVYVELHSISVPAFQFLNRVAIQTNREGGFGELFAEPLANVGTNLRMVSGGAKVLGFFNVASVSANSAYLDPANLPGPRN